MNETTFHSVVDQRSVPLDLEFGHNPALSRATLESRILSPQRVGFRSRGDVNGDSRLFSPQLPDLVESKKENERVSIDDDNSSISESHEGRAF